MKCFGLKWVALMVLVPVPWSQRVWALPFLTALSWPEGCGRRVSHKTSIDWTRQMVLQVRRWLPERELILFPSVVCSPISQPARRWPEDRIRQQRTATNRPCSQPSLPSRQATFRHDRAAWEATKTSARWASSP